MLPSLQMKEMQELLLMSFHKVDNDELKNTPSFLEVRF